MAGTRNVVRSAMASSSGISNRPRSERGGTSPYVDTTTMSMSSQPISPDLSSGLMAGAKRQLARFVACDFSVGI